MIILKMATKYAVVNADNWNQIFGYFKSRRAAERYIMEREEDL